MKQCRYNLVIPTVGTCCAVYSCSKRPDGQFWAHFPQCSEENCPLKHPELLEGAIFDKEDFNKTLKRAKAKERIGRK